MGRQSCCVKQKLRKGLWSPEEDEKLFNHITRFGVGCWSSVPKVAGLQRCGKSCRLRWINYLRPDLKRGMFSQEEEDLILSLHEALGNRWAQIAAQLPGRTDNEIKNFWNSCLKKRLMKQGIDPNTHKPMTQTQVKIEKDCLDSDTSHQHIILQSKLLPISHPSSHFPNTILTTNGGEGLTQTPPINENNFVAKHIYDPLFMSQYQTSLNNVPNGYRSKYLPNCPYAPNINPNSYGFNSMPNLTNLDHNNPNMMDTDYSDGSGQKMSPFVINEGKESTSAYASAAAFSWNGEDKFEDHHGFYQYDNNNNNFNGIDQIDERKPSVWNQDSGDYSNSCYSLTSLSQELSGGNLDVFHQI